jgi:hypothetical protein
MLFAVVVVVGTRRGSSLSELYKPTHCLCCWHSIFNTFLKKLSHALPQRAPVDSIQIGNNSIPLASSQATLYLVYFPVLAISAARPGLRAAESDKGADAASTGIGHVIHLLVRRTTGLLTSGRALVVLWVGHSETFCYFYSGFDTTAV